LPLNYFQFIEKLGSKHLLWSNLCQTLHAFFRNEEVFILSVVTCCFGMSITSRIEPKQLDQVITNASESFPEFLEDQNDGEQRNKKNDLC
jgi:hypothetical protein